MNWTVKLMFKNSISEKTPCFCRKSQACKADKARRGPDHQAELNDLATNLLEASQVPLEYFEVASHTWFDIISTYYGT